MEMLQLGVSDSHTLVPDRNQEAGMTIGRVMDWVEARLDAVRCREEEEDEEDERERGSHSSAPHASGSHRPSAPAHKPSPSPPPPSRVTAGPSSPPRSLIPLKPTRTPPQLKPASSTVLAPPAPSTDFHVPSGISFPFLENLPPPVTGSKRRHAVMMMPPPNSSPQSTPSSSSSPLPTQRRRTRSTRGLFPHNRGEGVDGMMDVEEDGGRERETRRKAIVSLSLKFSWAWVVFNALATTTCTNYLSLF
ncbi:hypothetical protein MVEN_01368000 [Mycena venus]|uniref:Uncharacterized protein n=1 Tax=Mycena venus TaxID=2733690 RepID=A0A8H7CSF0_9AGAR|nr:hypothetical protein MVEN_01368000 [Mycena venus]